MSSGAPACFPTDKVEAALALVENETGAIKALVGGKGVRDKAWF